MDVDAARASPEERGNLLQLVGEMVGKPFLERYDLQAQVRKVIESAQFMSDFLLELLDEIKRKKVSAE